MPLYVYQVVEADGSDGEVFEVLQSYDEPQLTHHPENGKPVRRLFSAPNAGRKYGGDKLSSSNLERHDFTRYEKSGGGTYEKTAGQGPNVISGD